MDDDLKKLINKYKGELADTKGFNPCTNCCDLASAQEKEYWLEKFIEDLELIAQ
ncbi:hypothetical protein [Exiguobacterium sp. S22-S28]|uniref:hypothetical protein n=1 Tax=Exiguobacterium sp. S22-S28 TaxID=3342768 RepID=UPI00372D2FBA